ncbi:MAG: hypothetical protein IKP68_03205 [Clostridia bacterium]|nr:hypothetical protein [Clostridia bacterium]
MNANQKKRRAEKRALTALLIIAAILLLYVGFCFISNHVLHGEFMKNTEKLGKIPDLLGGFTPQGMTAVEGTDVYMICGYLSGDANSRIYRYDADGKIVKILLEYENGKAYSGHAGGFTAAGEYIYISNASKIFVLRTDDVLNAKSGDTVRFIGRFEVPCRASFCSSDGTTLYVGEFHADGYDTEADHKILTANGTYEAMVFGYTLSDSGELGVLDTKTPHVAYSVCDKVQGFAVIGGETAALSCSHGLNASELKTYDVTGEADATFKIGEHDVPLYLLDKNREKTVIGMPHMSEDIEYRNGALYIVFESAVRKYGAGVLPCSLFNVIKYKF